MKKGVMVKVLFLCVLLVVGTGGWWGSLASAKEPIKLGMIGDLSKVQAPVTKIARDAVMMYIKKCNLEGGINGHSIELIMVDSELSAPKAMAAVERLITVDNVLALFGPTSSTETIAAKAAAERERVPLMAVVTSAVPVTAPINKSTWTFRVFPRNDDMAGMNADLLVKLGKRIGLSYSSSAYGVDGRSQIEKALKERHGVKPVATQPIEPGAADLTAYVLKFKDAGVDVIMSWNLTGDGAALLKAMALVGWNVPVIGNFTDTPAYQAITGKVAIDQYSMATLHPANDVAQEARQLYERTYGERLSTEEDYFPPACDCARIVLNALKKANVSFAADKLAENRARVRDAMEATDIPSVQGVPGKRVTFLATNHDFFGGFFKRTKDGVNWEPYVME